jgi:hypothetical protein
MTRPAEGFEVVATASCSDCSDTSNRSPLCAGVARRDLDREANTYVTSTVARPVHLAGRTPLIVRQRADPGRIGGRGNVQGFMKVSLVAIEAFGFRLRRQGDGGSVGPAASPASSATSRQ